MTIDDYIDALEDKMTGLNDSELEALESAMGCSLPLEYRALLSRVNGGSANGDLWFKAPTPSGRTACVGLAELGGLRDDYMSLVENRQTYQATDNLRIPSDTRWFMGCPFGNAYCIGVGSNNEGFIYFWQHEEEFHDDTYDGTTATAQNMILLAHSLGDFIAGVDYGT